MSKTGLFFSYTSSTLSCFLPSKHKASSIIRKIWLLPLFSHSSCPFITWSNVLFSTAQKSDMPITTLFLLLPGITKNVSRRKVPNWPFTVGCFRTIFLPEHLVWGRNYWHHSTERQASLFSRVVLPASHQKPDVWRGNRDMCLHGELITTLCPILVHNCPPIIRQLWKYTMRTWWPKKIIFLMHSGTQCPLRNPLQKVF